MDKLRNIFALLAIAGAGFWISQSPNNPEPYITLIGAIIAVLPLMKFRDEAELIVRLLDIGKDQQLVIENISREIARDIKLEILNNTNLESNKEIDIDIFPIDILYPMQKFSFYAKISNTKNSVFKIQWSWKTNNRKKVLIRNGTISLEATKKIEKRLPPPQQAIYRK